MQRIFGWVLTVLIGLMLLGPSAMGKFVDWEGKEEMLQKMGLTQELLMGIGILEVVIAILYLLPWTSFVGAILVTGYLGGAIMTHLRMGESVVLPIVLGVLAWVGLGLRRPEIFRMAMGMGVSSKEASGNGA